MVVRAGSSSARGDQRGEHLDNLTGIFGAGLERSSGNPCSAPGALSNQSLGKETVPDEQLLNFWCILEHAEGRVHDYEDLDY